MITFNVIIILLSLGYFFVLLYAYMNSGGDKPGRRKSNGNRNTVTYDKEIEGYNKPIEEGNRRENINI